MLLFYCLYFIILWQGDRGLLIVTGLLALSLLLLQS